MLVRTLVRVSLSFTSRQIQTAPLHKIPTQRPKQSAFRAQQSKATYRSARGTGLYAANYRKRECLYECVQPCMRTVYGVCTMYTVKCTGPFSSTVMFVGFCFSRRRESEVQRNLTKICCDALWFKFARLRIDRSCSVELKEWFKHSCAVIKSSHLN